MPATATEWVSKWDYYWKCYILSCMYSAIRIYSIRMFDMLRLKTEWSMFTVRYQNWMEQNWFGFYSLNGERKLQVFPRGSVTVTLASQICRFGCCCFSLMLNSKSHHNPSALLPSIWMSISIFHFSANWVYSPVLSPDWIIIPTSGHMAHWTHITYDGGPLSCWINVMEKFCK